MLVIGQVKPNTLFCQKLKFVNKYNNHRRKITYLIWVGLKINTFISLTCSNDDLYCCLDNCGVAILYNWPLHYLGFWTEWRFSKLAAGISWSPSLTIHPLDLWCWLVCRVWSVSLLPTMNCRWLLLHWLLLVLFATMRGPVTLLSRFTLKPDFLIQVMGMAIERLSF